MAISGRRRLDYERVAELLREGLPLNWIAEDVGALNRGSILRISKKLGIDTTSSSAAFHAVWPEIMHNPELLKLHRQFSPGGA